MSSTVRIDEVETQIRKEIDNGSLLNNLSKELIRELKEINLLEPLISKRVERIVNEAIAVPMQKHEAEDREETDNAETRPMQDRIANEWFGSQVDRYYLERRDDFERVSFQMFRTKIKGISIEAHQRLVEGEESWKEINNRWGMDRDRQNEGKYLSIKPKHINKEIYRGLKRLKEGEISEPIRSGKLIAVVKLIAWKKIELNAELRGQLEMDLFRTWIRDKTNEILDDID